VHTGNDLLLMKTVSHYHSTLTDGQCSVCWIMSSWLKYVKFVCSAVLAMKQFWLQRMTTCFPWDLTAAAVLDWVLQLFFDFTTPSLTEASVMQLKKICQAANLDFKSIYSMFLEKILSSCLTIFGCFQHQTNKQLR
jgi:hypothetical protein